VATVNLARSQASEYGSAEAYGKHSRANARGLSVAELLRRVVHRGEAFRLAWRGGDSDAPVDRREEFPTGVLPVVGDQLADALVAEEDTEPTTAMREARKWLQAPSFSWWLRLLAA
jgi:hypothetical protein